MVYLHKRIKNSWMKIKNNVSEPFLITRHVEGCLRLIQIIRNTANKDFFLKNPTYIVTKCSHDRTSEVHKIATTATKHFARILGDELKIRNWNFLPPVSI